MSGVLEGYLDKRGDKNLRAWKERWCRVQGARIFYWDKRVVKGGENEARGTIELRGASVVLAKDEKGRFRFDIRSPDGKKITQMGAKSEDERELWMRGINAAISNVTVGRRQESDVGSTLDFSSVPRRRSTAVSGSNSVSANDDDDSRSQGDPEEDEPAPPSPAPASTAGAVSQQPRRTTAARDSSGQAPSLQAVLDGIAPSKSAAPASKPAAVAPAPEPAKPTPAAPVETPKPAAEPVKPAAAEPIAPTPEAPKPVQEPPKAVPEPVPVAALIAAPEPIKPAPEPVTEPAQPAPVPTADPAPTAAPVATATTTSAPEPAASEPSVVAHAEEKTPEAVAPAATAKPEATNEVVTPTPAPEVPHDGPPSVAAPTDPVVVPAPTAPSETSDPVQVDGPTASKPTESEPVPAPEVKPAEATPSASTEAAPVADPTPSADAPSNATETVTTPAVIEAAVAAAVVEVVPETAPVTSTPAEHTEASAVEATPAPAAPATVEPEPTTSDAAPRPAAVVATSTPVALSSPAPAATPREPPPTSPTSPIEPTSPTSPEAPEGDEANGQPEENGGAGDDDEDEAGVERTVSAPVGAAPVLDPKHIVMSSFLDKRGEGMLASWKTRWCRLQGDRVYYFKEKTLQGRESKAAGFIDLRGAEVRMIGKEKSGRHRFDVLVEGGRVFELGAASAGQAQDWCRNMIIITRQGGGLQQPVPVAAPQPRGRKSTDVGRTTSEPAMSARSRANTTHSAVDEGEEEGEEDDDGPSVLPAGVDPRAVVPEPSMDEGRGRGQGSSMSMGTTNKDTIEMDIEGALDKLSDTAVKSWVTYWFAVRGPEFAYWRDFEAAQRSRPLGTIDLRNVVVTEKPAKGGHFIFQLEYPGQNKPFTLSTNSEKERYRWVRSLSYVSNTLRAAAAVGAREGATYVHVDDEEAEPHSVDAPPVLAGYLKKRGEHMSRWKDFWFRLESSGYVFYWKSASELDNPDAHEHAKGFFKLANVRSVDYDEKNSTAKEFHFNVALKDGTRVYQLSADSEFNRERWVASMKSQLSGAGDKPLPGAASRFKAAPNASGVRREPSMNPTQPSQTATPAPGTFGSPPPPAVPAGPRPVLTIDDFLPPMQLPPAVVTAVVGSPSSPSTATAATGPEATIANPDYSTLGSYNTKTTYATQESLAGASTGAEDDNDEGDKAVGMSKLTPKGKSKKKAKAGAKKKAAAKKNTSRMPTIGSPAVRSPTNPTNPVTQTKASPAPAADEEEILLPGPSPMQYGSMNTGSLQGGSLQGEGDAETNPLLAMGFSSVPADEEEPPVEESSGCSCVIL